MFKPVGKRFLVTLVWLALCLCTLGTLAPAHAAKFSERSKQKRLAETQRADLQQKLATLKREIDRTETAKNNTADALAHSEAAISEANRSLRDLAEEQQQTEARLELLSKQQAELAQTIEAQQQQLARLLREQYQTGNEDRIKLLLSGDNPNRINRDLQYMGYVSQAQARLIATLRVNLQTVEANQAETENAKNDLDEIAQEQRAQMALLEKEKANRATLLSQLSGKLASQRKEVSNIKRDEQRLGGLVDKLSRLIEEQQKADAVAQEKRRQEQIRAKAAREKQHVPKTKGATKYPDAIDNDEAPATSARRNELNQESVTPIGASSNGFTSLRGQLHWPLKGDLVAKFGSKRGDGPSWKGLFIRAAEGTEVKAVAAGRVVFADWLRGFGNLIIVDHGDQYMSIYGNNQAVLKHAGDAVKIGDVIASVGNSGGNEQSGLYFEIRHEGHAFDPLTWMSPGSR